MHSQGLDLATPVRFYPGLGFAPTIATQPESNSAEMRLQSHLKQPEETSTKVKYSI